MAALERRWRNRLETQQRESARKAAAAAASGRVTSFDSSQGSRQNVVTQTASWLDRAKSVLKEPTTTAEVSVSNREGGDLETQMQEVQRLIHEGPVIQQSSAGLPHVLDVDEDQAASPSNSDTEPVDKRLRTAEDAETLVGFLRSVRASAASGQDC